MHDAGGLNNHATANTTGVAMTMYAIQTDHAVQRGDHWTAAPAIDL